MNQIKASESWLARRVENEIKDLACKKRGHLRIGIAIGAVLIIIVFYLFAHQLSSTGFFTATFGTLEMLLLYGSLIEWIVVAALETLGRKSLSRDIDAFGGTIFVTIGGIWLFVVFPFEFAHFADVLPDFLRFLVQWISSDIARVVLVLWTIFNGVSAIYYGMLRVLVRKQLSKRKQK